MSAVNLGGGVFIVASGEPDSPAFTDRLDCTCYLIRSDDGRGLAIDTGAGRAVAAWLANVSQIMPLAAVEAVLVTHYHGDHAGGAAGAAAAGLRLVGHQLTARALALGDEITTAVALARQAGVYPPEYRLEPCPAVEVVQAGRWLELAGLTTDLIETPGHCDGHLCAVVRRAEALGEDSLPMAAGGDRAVTLGDFGAPTAVGCGVSDGSVDLFSGDVVFAGGQVSLQAVPDCRLDRYAQSIIQLAALTPTRLLPGHGPSQGWAAAEWLERAAASFRALVPPPNFLRPVGFD